MHKAAKAAFWFMICSFLQKGMSILTTPIFTRLMSTEQYGQFTVYSSWLNILTVITTLRLNYSVFNKGMSKYKDRRGEYTSTMQYITSAMCLLLLLIYLLFRNSINRLTELPTFIMLAIIGELMVTPAISFWTLKKRYEYVYRDVVIRTLLMALFNALLGVLAVITQEEKGYARILSCVIVNICFGIPIYLYNLKKGDFKFNREYAQFALLFNLPLIGHFVSIYILDQFDRIMIQKMVSFEAAALYGLTYHIGTLLKMFTTSLSHAMIPWMYGKLEKRDFAAVDHVIFSVSILVALIDIGIIVIAPEAIAIFAPARYMEAVYVVPPVALGIVFQFLYVLYGNVELFFDYNKATMFISGGAALLNVVLNYVGIRMFGYIAAAYTTLLCYILMSIGHYLYMMYGIKKTTGDNAPFHGQRMIVLSSVLLSSGILLIFLYPYTIVRYVLVAFAVCVAFLKRKIILNLLQSIRKPENERS